MKQIVVLLCTLCASMPSWAQDEGPWNYRKMENRVRRVCSGSNGNWILRMGHPQLTFRGLYRNWTTGQIFTESILSAEVSGRLLDLTKTRMTSSESCFEVSGFFLSYELMGFEALASLRDAFQDSGITENCEHTAADDDLRALYLQCSKIEFNERYATETGGELVFSQDMIASVRKRIANKLLIERRPRTCEQIEEIDDDIYRSFTAAQRKFRKKLKAGGFVKTVYGHDWS